jgi:nitrate/TMAO reductase-like tetraheme cytochrome c subunit
MKEDDNEPNNEQPATPSKSSGKIRVPSLLRNYVSFIGLGIAGAAFTSFVLLFLVEITGKNDNPYSDLITYIFVPSILGFGLVVALIGALLERRRRFGMSAEEIGKYPILDLNDPRRRRMILVAACLAFIFVFMTAFGSYRAYEYTESIAFCGIACHSVMKPEYVAYQASPHARILCVECHVGGGTQAYVKSKFTGMRQLYGIVTGHYNRPIETPVANMRSATETCQKCHWSEKYHGDKMKAFNHYGYDEKNSLNRTRMLIKVGGGDPFAGPVGGIHWHMNISNEITFIASDRQRTTIPWIRMKDSTGKVVEFKTKDTNFSNADIERAEKRTMDCIDCHNRPAHIYLSPNQAVDQALEAGKLNIEMPFIKAKAVEVLAKPYSTNDEAMTGIDSGIRGYYRDNYPQVVSASPDSITNSVTELQRIYQTYFFPEMNTNWESHPNNIGHYNAQGCFRCHDGQHFAADGRVIRNECSVCHVTIDQTFGGKTISDANGVFQHPVNLGDKNTWQCAACHKGDRTFSHPVKLGDISQFKCSDCHTGQNPRMDLSGM